MSRRGVSVRQLGEADCRGWLLRRKEGRSFLGGKWMRYWFVLKKSSLYWYTSKTAQKAEGFIDLSGFTVEAAKQGRKKHAVTARHPLVVTLFIAAENFTDMNMWVSKLSQAAETCEPVNAEECYSEGSDQDADDEHVSTSCPLNSEQEADDSENGDVLRPLRESPTGDAGRRSASEGGGLSRNRRRGRGRGRGRGRASEGGEPPSRLLHLPGPDGAAGGAPPPLLPVHEDAEEEAVHEKPPDEMEFLYNRLRAASLSPIGRSSRRDFRASFVRRCQNDKVNDKLHLLRILSSTLKAKESELLALDQVLTDPGLVAPAYRKWRLSNLAPLQEVARRRRATGGAVSLKRDHSQNSTHESA